MRLIVTVCFGLAVVCSTAVAEIEKFAIPSEGGISFYWWPKLPPLEGWQQDREQSFRFGVNALAPHGFTFADAETVMYAKAVYKPREPATKSLEMLIDKDKETFAARIPGITIEEVASLSTADGKKLRSITFFPRSKGNWERVSYGEEDEFYLIFTLSSRSLSGYKAAMDAYEQLIGCYKEKP